MITELQSEVVNIQLHHFSNTGTEYIVVDSERSLVSFFKLDSKISSLINKVSQQMVHNPKFWKDYPINLNTVAPLSKEEKAHMKKQKLER